MTSHTIEQERERIEATIGDLTLVDVMARNAEQHGDQPAIHWQENGGWTSLTWSAYRQTALELAAGFRTLGVGKGDFVALMAANRAEHVLADMGVVHAGASPVTLYNTLAPKQIAYIAGHCEAKAAVLENLEYMKRWEEIKAELPNLRYVVLLEGAENYQTADWVLSWEDLLARGREALAADRAAVEEAGRSLTPDDIATLIYTSGTTGTPKGVVITHRNVLFTTEATDQTLDLPDHARSISYLPLAHIAERMATHYLGMWKLGQVYYCPDMNAILETVQHARPELFLGVPRVWEKFQVGLMAKLQAEPNSTRRKLAMAAIAAGEEAVRAQQEGRRLPLPARLKHLLLERLVLSKIRHGLGMDEVEIAVTAAAPIAPELVVFFNGIGLPLYELYGMTESSGPGVTNRPGHNKIGTVGQRYMGVELATAEDGEIVMRGGIVTGGYYKAPEATAETFASDGWLHTGDLGILDDEGYLTIIGRKKEIIITAAGKNIAPAKLESIIKQHPLVSQVCLIGDQRRYITALVALDAEVAPEWAAKHGLDYVDLAALAQHPTVQAEMERLVDEANAQVARVEQVKKYRVVGDDWSPESGELTPSLKLKRRVVHEKYAAAIDELYAED